VWKARSKWEHKTTPESSRQRAETLLTFSRISMDEHWRGDTLARLELLLENLQEQRQALDTAQKCAATAASVSAVNDEAIIALQNGLRDGSVKLWLELAMVNATQEQISDSMVDIVKKLAELQTKLETLEAESRWPELAAYLTAGSAIGMVATNIVTWVKCSPSRLQ
jgi:hypothetical protein